MFRTLSATGLRPEHNTFRLRRILILQVDRENISFYREIGKGPLINRRYHYTNVTVKGPHPSAVCVVVSLYTHTHVYTCIYVLLQTAIFQSEICFLYFGLKNIQQFSTHYNYRTPHSVAFPSSKRSSTNVPLRLRKKYALYTWINYSNIQLGYCYQIGILKCFRYFF